MARAMTPRQRAALKKAQIASANKRRGTGKKRPVRTKLTAKQKNARIRELKANNAKSNAQYRKEAGSARTRKARVQTLDRNRAAHKNRRQEIRNKYRVAQGKSAKNKNFTAKGEARKRRAVQAAIVAGYVAYQVHNVNKASKAAGGATVGQAASYKLGKTLHGVANKKRASTGRKKYAASKGIGSAKTHAKTKKASYAKSRGRGKKKVYKVTTAKRARRR